MQDNFTKFGSKHSLTFGGTLERYHSENVFFPGSQSVYVYNSLDDFYTDANGFLANPNRTTSPMTLRRFQVRWNNIPGQDKPIQPLRCWYTRRLRAGRVAAAHEHDDHRAACASTCRSSTNTGYDNPNADALTFRDETGSRGAVQQRQAAGCRRSCGRRASASTGTWRGNQQTQVRGGTGVFTGQPAYVWISNQIGNTGVLTGFDQIDNTDQPAVQPRSRTLQAGQRHRRAGAPATSWTSPTTNFKFPQVWRTQHRRRSTAARGG